MLCEKVHTIARSNRRTAPVAAPTPRTPARQVPWPVRQQPRPAVRRPRRPAVKRKSYRLVAIGTSTGGPVALQRVLTQLPANFPAPIVLIQHMPAAFTKAFAERLDKLCRISVKEAEDGDLLRPGLALLPLAASR